jgi:hypothetical protein
MPKEPLGVCLRATDPSFPRSLADFQGLKRDCRTAVQKAQRCGVLVEEAAPNEEFIQEYYAQLTEVFLKQNLLPTYSVQKVRTFLQYLFPTGNLALFRARNKEGECIATGICHGVDKFALLWGTASLRKYLPLRPNEALHWHALQYWKRAARSTSIGEGRRLQTQVREPRNRCDQAF